MVEECLSLSDKLKDGDYDENIRHLKYKLASLSKLATEQLKEKSSTIDLLLEDLKEISQAKDTLQEDLKQLQSLQVQPEPIKDPAAVKEEPSSPSMVYQPLEYQTSMSMMNLMNAMLLVVYLCSINSFVAGQTRT